MSDPLHKAGFDHPCRQTCSGWQQGYERGLDELKKKWDKAHAEYHEKINEEFKERDQLQEALEWILRAQSTVAEMNAYANAKVVLEKWRKKREKS